ncbi:MAG: FAD-dependent oxidoreductase [Bacilli bacterium]
MAEMSKTFVPEFIGDKNPSKNILKLCTKITDCIDHKIKGVTVNDPEYWGLKCLITDEDARVCLKMKVRHPYTLDELCKMNKDYSREDLEALYKKLSDYGMIEYNYGDHYNDDGPIPGAPHEKHYILPMFVPGSAEFTNMVKKQLDDHPELAMFFERMTYLPLKMVTPMVPAGGAGIGMHVIPVEKAIEVENKSISIERISYWLKKYEGHIGVGICSCRYGRGKLNEGVADSADDWCLGIGDMADYCRETGKGHDVTYEEAMAILKNAEANGFVHQITNIDGEDHIFAICNCNVNICNALRTSQLFNTPNMSSSAYTAKVDKDKCVACGKCVEFCPAGAVKLGQKLCAKDGSEIQYPKHILPDNMPWGEDMWDENYRDNNRINCYETGTAPCKTACPAHVAVQGYLKLAALGRYQEALALIKKDNPFPAICGRICNHRCEEACTRGTIDDPVAIDPVKKFLADLDLKSETRYVPEVVIASNVEKQWSQKIAIIGAGPAGLSCAYYLATKGYKPTIFEKNAKAGGMMTYGIPSYKLEKDVVQAEIDVLLALGVEIKCGVEVGKDVTIAQLKEQGYQAFYVAIGCQGGRLPGVAGDTAPECTYAVKFLHDASENHDQTLDGEVVVVGGGNVAVDCARTAKRFHASKVSMFCLEDRATMPASDEEVKETLEEDIDINNSWGPKEVLLDDQGHVKGIVFKKCVSTIDPETKRFNPKYDETQTMTVDCKHIVFAIGQAIVWGDLLKDSKVGFWHGNYPIADGLTYQTADPDIFVGGDVYTGPKFAIDAIEAGKCAAESLHRYVHKGASLTIGRNRRDFIMLNKDNINVFSYDHNKRQDAGVDPKIDSKTSFKDAHNTLAAEQVKIETARCLGCGASVVDPNKCIGCGVCTTKCAFDAIHLFRDHPERSNLAKSEDKFKKILPYAMKRGMKIVFGKHTEEEKAIIKKHKQWKKDQKKASKASKNA